MICPLCGSASPKKFSNANVKKYYRCCECKIIFLDAEFYLTQKEEKERYEFHNNDPTDESYITHLKKLTDPLLKFITSGSTGLDYGCGEGKPLSHIYVNEGIIVNNYDPFFYKDESLLNKKYDFITCTETAEHFHNPGKEFDRFSSMLKPSGILGIMTTFYSDDIKFDDWWYPRDPTHISFFSRETLNWICNKYSYRMLSFDKENNISIMQSAKISN